MLQATTLKVRNDESVASGTAMPARKPDWIVHHYPSPSPRRPQQYALQAIFGQLQERHGLARRERLVQVRSLRGPRAW
jgi:hypothetical protein